MTAYIYINSEPQLWTVGFYRPDGTWEPESDHISSESAAGRVIALNGGGFTQRLIDLEKGLESALEELAEHRAAWAKARDFRRAVCTAAHAVALPGSDALRTGFEDACGLHGPDCTAHAHELLTDEAREALAALAALDESGYGPAHGGSLMAHGILGPAQPGPTGYDGGDHAEPCLVCGAGASVHLCPAVVT
jgi:hypothetical protein